jgi:hypothetical protein
MRTLRRWLNPVLLSLGLVAFVACIESQNPTGDGSWPVDPDPPEEPDPDVGPRVAFTVPEGDLAGRYVFADRMTCEPNPVTGFPWVHAQLDGAQAPAVSAGFVLITFGLEPDDYDFLNGGWEMGWDYLERTFDVEPGPTCFIQVMDGWPEMTALFECSSGVTEFGETLDVEMVEGVIECP